MVQALFAQTQTETPPLDIARLVFAVFIFATDSEKDITPQEVQRFHALTADPSWAENADLRSALQSLRASYGSLWAAYETKQLPAGRETIAAALSVLETRLGDERAAAFKAGLNDFLQRLQAGSFATARFGLSDPRGRARAKTELEGLLRTPEPEPAPVEARPVPPVALRSGSAPAVAVAPAPAGTTVPGLVGAEIWTGGKIRVVCVGVTQETHDSKTYTFAGLPPRLFTYKPGQFVTLELPIEGRLLRRSYTISSSPSRPYTISITVKRVAKGWISNWLYEEMKPGFELDLTGPHGHFTCVDHPARKILMIAGGSGITPIMSMLRWIADTATPADIVLINNVRSPDDVIFGSELLYLSGRLGSSLRLAIVPGSLKPGQAWNGICAKFDEALLRSLAPDFLEREAFVCGPGGYMAAIKEMLLSLGMPAERYHDESFGGVTVPAAAPAAPAARTQPAPALATVPHQPAAVVAAPEAPAAVIPLGQVAFSLSGRAVVLELGESILEAAERQGLPLEHSCRSGVCGACKVKKVRGTVHMDEQQALSPEEIEAGYVLTCVGRAEGPVLLEA